MDTTVTLQDGAIARVLVERRCEKCQAWLTGGDMGHGSLAGLAAGRRMCDGKGAGRFRRRVFVATPTPKQREQVSAYYSDHPEFHPLLRWRKANTDERREALTRVEF